MLYTDGLTPTPDDINAIEPDLADELVADNVNISLSDLCSQAYSHCAGILASKLQSVIGATNFNPSGGASSLHNAAIIWGVRSQSNVVRLRMGQVVMDDLYGGDEFGASAASLQSPLRTWLIYWALILGYRKLVGRADPKNDRYRTKYNFLRNIDGGEKWNLLRSTGLPYVRVPFPAPGAIYERGSGTWDANNLTEVSASSTAGGIFDVAITWVDQSSPVFYISPLVKNNAESGPSLILPTVLSTAGLQTVTIDALNVLRVNIYSLNPPTGSVSDAQASVTGVTQGTRVATHWNVYVGVSQAGPLYLQNALPIPITQATFTLTGDPVLGGFLLGRGQYADANMPLADLMMRM